MATKKRRFGLFSRVFLVTGAIIGGSLPASAVFSNSFVYVPPTADLQDLDHHNAYMWTLSGLQTAQPYIGATLTISNINNWDLTKNILFMHLFDTALTTPAAGGSVVSGSGNNILTTFTDATGDPVTVLSDAFGPSSLATNPLVKQGTTTNVMLGTYVDGSFSGAGTVIDGVTVPNYQTGTFTPPASPNQPQTVTYNFTPSQLAALNSYITGAGAGDAGRISLGFDSDCHFFNDGITLTLTSVPEPGTAVAGLGCMLPILSSFFGRRRRS